MATPSFSTLSTSASTVLTTQDVVLVSASPSPVTITLESATTVGSGKVVWVGVEESFATTAVVKVQTQGGQTIGTSGFNATSYDMRFDGDMLQLVSDGSDWIAMSYPQERVLIMKHTLGNGANCGSSAASWSIRNINEKTGDDFTELDSNEFKLFRGEYSIHIYAMTLGSRSGKLRLRDANSGTVLDYGQNTQSEATTSNNVPLTLDHKFVVTSDSQTFDVQHIVETARATTGFGITDSSNTEEENCFKVVLRKLK